MSSLFRRVPFLKTMASIHEFGLTEAEEDLAALRAEEDFLRHAVEELSKLDPQPGEEAALDAKRRLMQSAERIREDVQRAGQLIGGDGAEGQAGDLIFARNDTVNPNIQPARGYQNIDDFVTNLTDLGLNKADLDSSELSVGTNYFIYNGEVIIGDKTRRIKTLMRRDRNKSSVEVLWRTDANF